MNFPHLFQPIKIGTVEIKNRVVLSPMGTSLAVDNVPTQRLSNYYAERAKGGAGLIILEHTYPQERGIKSKKSTGMWSMEHLPQWKMVVDQIHKNGAKVAVELGHLGRCTDYARRMGLDALAPSAVRCHQAQQKVQAATQADIEQFKKDYLNAVRIAVAAGFDMIELHFTNGYFMASWLSGRTNKRTDQYGGTLENRIRFPMEIYQMVRREVGPDYPLLARLASREVNSGRGIEETCLIAKTFAEAGLDALDINAGSPSEYDWEFPSYFQEQGFLLSDVERIKKVVSIPVIGGGRITEPRMADCAIADGRTDMVAIGRGQIADPYWVAKAYQGETQSIRRCIACTRCIHDKEFNGLICSVNPFVGREGEWIVTKAENPKKILIVGAGPSGLQAAIVCAQRGHRVTVVEKEQELGGMIRAACVPPLKWEMGNLICALAYDAQKAGVEILMGKEADAEWISSQKADEVLLAVGSAPIVPMVSSDCEGSFVTANDVLLGKEWVGDRVAIIGGGMIGCETADFLAEYHKEVTIFEMNDRIANDLQWNLRERLMKRMKELDIQSLTKARVAQIKNGMISYEQNGMTCQVGPFDTVVWAVGLRSNAALKQQLEEKGLHPLVIGDAQRVSKLCEALISAVQTTLNL